MPIDHSGKRFYTTMEACERIGRCKNAVLRWIMLGQIANVKQSENGHRVWTDEDIERYRKHRDSIKEKVIETRRKQVIESRRKRREEGV
jgi:pyrimidine deaminase RibD-like protein